jgi:hypothetical protein
VRAAFDVYFEGNKKPRAVQVRPPNIVRVGRHGDAVVVAKWLSEKRFRETVTAGNIGTAPFALNIHPALSPLAVPQSAGLAQAATWGRKIGRM